MKQCILGGAIMRGLCGIAIGLAITVVTLPASAQGVEAGTTGGAGALLSTGSGNPVFLPQGFTSVALEYPTTYESTLCSVAGPASGSTAQVDLIAAQNAMTGSNASLEAMAGSGWDANTVRFHVSQGALAYEKTLSQTPTPPYTQMVWNEIAAARSEGLIVILVMQTEGYSCSPLVQQQNAPNTATPILQKLPDQITENAWYQLLNGTTITSDRGVMLEVLNEPSVGTQCNLSYTGSYPYSSSTWDQWAYGCTGQLGAPNQTDLAGNQGMVTVGNYMEGLNGGISNVLIFDADNGAGGFNSFDTSLFSAIPANSAYTVHPFDYIYSKTTPTTHASEANWDGRFGQFEESTGSAKAILVTAWNEALGCRTSLDPSETIAKDLVKTYLPTGHNAGLLGVGWDSPTNDAGYLVASYGSSPSYGQVDSNSQCSITGADVLQAYFTR